MSSVHSSGKSDKFHTKPAKPAKPYPEFPLTAHPAGYWCKRIKGKLHYFGRWDDPDAALALYLKQKDALHAGRKPREETEGFTMRSLCNDFLNAKAATRDAGEIAPRTWTDYKDACDLLIGHFGKARLVADLDPDDFASLRDVMARKWGPGTVGNTIQRMRVVFKFAFDNGLIDRPVRYGQGFKRPSRKVLRIHKAKQGPKLLEREEILALLGEASVHLKAMILLGINAGFGNQDCGTLTRRAVNLDKAVIDFPRPKTGIARRCPLWPETVEALKASIATRPDPRSEDHADLYFVTKYGGCWAKDVADSPVTKEFAKLLRKLNITKRKGLGYYTLRHTFRTVADEVKDAPAVYYVMGHEIPDISSHYRERIKDDRLKAVTDHVRQWLFTEEGKS